MPTYMSENFVIVWETGNFNSAPVSFSSYCIYEGAAYEPQESELQLGIDILVGTPGQTLDHVTRGSLDLSELRSEGGRCPPSKERILCTHFLFWTRTFEIFGDWGRNYKITLQAHLKLITGHIPKILFTYIHQGSVSIIWKGIKGCKYQYNTIFHFQFHCCSWHLITW